MLQELTRIGVIVMETCRSRVLYAIHLEGAVRILCPEYKDVSRNIFHTDVSLFEIKKEMKLCTDVRISDCAVFYMASLYPLRPVHPLEKGAPQNTQHPLHPLEKGALQNSQLYLEKKTPKSSL
jgi:hypothetical protein